MVTNRALKCIDPCLIPVIGSQVQDIVPTLYGVCVCVFKMKSGPKFICNQMFGTILLFASCSKVERQEIACMKSKCCFHETPNALNNYLRF